MKIFIISAGISENSVLNPYLIGHFKRRDDGLDGGDLSLVEEDEGVLVLDLEERMFTSSSLNMVR